MTQRSVWLEYPRGVVASSSEMAGMGGSSEAVTVVAIRSDGSFSIKCYRRGEFGALGESGPAIWYRVGSSVALRSPDAAVMAIQSWSDEIDGTVEWSELFLNLTSHYPQHKAGIAQLIKSVEDHDR